MSVTVPAELQAEDILIRVQPTPNPMALKFILNVSLKEEGKATFHDPVECEGLPLVRDVFTVAGVRQVHIFQNSLTVTHSGELADAELARQVEAVLRTRMDVHNPHFQQGFTDTSYSHGRRTHDDPVLEQIESILDRTIRPGLQADGGDLEVLKLENNELHILYQGACGGCPSSMMGTLDAIQGILQHELNNPDLLVIPA